MVDYTCDKCGKGQYRPDGYALMSSPPQYPHECNECGHKATFKVKYPYIEYVES